MIMTTNVCKGCSGNVIIKKEEVDRILSKHLPDNLIVSDEIYKKRLEACQDCPSFVYGTTCSYSGCLVEYRAKFTSKNCPNPAGAKW